MSSPSRQDLKSQIRREGLARRAGPPEDVREAFAGRLALEGVALARRAVVRTVGVFWPIGTEPDTRQLLAALDYHEFIPALPVAGPVGAPLTFRRWREGEPLVQGAMRIPEPAASLPEAAPDLLFVPCAAFDRRGFRAGYGGGYYDATLSALRARRPIPAIGVAFACQEVAALPEEAHDEPLDLILTESELIDCSLAWSQL